MRKDCREEFYALMKDCGFESFRQFAKETGVAVANIHSNLTGRYNLSIERAFIIADTLKVPITDILDMFYPDEMAENYNAVKG